jgi:CubicO group peptidase (beta-lactamase class C family)
MKRFWRQYVLFGLLLLFGQSCEKDKPVNIDVNAEIIQEMQDLDAPSVVAAIVKGDEISWEGTYGYANVADSKPATRTTLYSLESISKLVLATVVMQLWENGEIDLDADINHYLPFDVRNPNYPDEVITSYHLLTHTSGLAWPQDHENIPDFHHFYAYEDPPLIGDWLPEYILPEGAQYRSIVWKDFKPGEMWLYSNIGTSLLALVVEQIAGQDYRDYCRVNVLNPLGMKNSGYYLGQLDPELLVTPYTKRNGPMAPFVCRYYPIGFLYTNIEDFSHFMAAILNRGMYKGVRILKESTVNKMLEIQNPVSGVSMLWWHQYGSYVGHSGGGTGFSTWAEWNMDEKKGLFLFTNKQNGAVWPGTRIHELVKYQATFY